MPSLSYKQVIFSELDVRYGDIETYRPRLPAGYYYLGPAALGSKSPIPHARGLIIKPSDPSALDDIVDWSLVFADDEGKFSTWCGIPKNPRQYVSLSHIFTIGTKRPTQRQTLGIKAVRRDLVEEIEPHHRIWTSSCAKTIFTIWDVFSTDLLHIPTGAFVSSVEHVDTSRRIGVLRFGA